MDVDVKTWVAEHFGDDQASKLKHIEIGAENFRKGSLFEHFYAASKICCLAAELDASALDDYQLGCRDVAFVDDLCVRQISANAKINYQAKNSDGAAANWTGEIQSRFDMQHQIDIELHLAAVSTQVLLVSDVDKAAANDAKIPGEMKEYCESEYFPYHTSSTQLVLGHRPLLEALTTLCGTTSYSTADGAFRVVLGEWCGDNAADRTVGDVMRRASAIAKPDFFAPFAQRLANLQETKAAMPLSPADAPVWLVELLASFQMPMPSVECGAFIVSYNGMQARVASDVMNPKSEALSELKSPGDIFLFLMSLAAEGLDDQLPTGETVNEHGE